MKSRVKYLVFSINPSHGYATVSLYATLKIWEYE